MTRIPPAALLLTLGGLVPFVYAALIHAQVIAPVDAATRIGIGPEGRLVMARYGVVILCFMAGVQWGFATRTEGARAAAGYALSTLPALWAFLAPARTADTALTNLIIGFVAVLMLDIAYRRWGLAPPWWLALRVPVTAAVVLCLAVGIWL